MTDIGLTVTLVARSRRQSRDKVAKTTQTTQPAVEIRTTPVTHLSNGKLATLDSIIGIAPQHPETNLATKSPYLKSERSVKQSHTDLSPMR